MQQILLRLERKQFDGEGCDKIHISTVSPGGVWSVYTKQVRERDGRVDVDAKMQGVKRWEKV